MASVSEFLDDITVVYAELQRRFDEAENVRSVKYKAARTIQRFARGRLIRNYIVKLNLCATNIQRHWRGYVGRKLYYERLKEALREMFQRYYNHHATVIQKTYRGFWSREHLFSYLKFKRWLSRVRSKNEEMLVENENFRQETKTSTLELLEQEARQWVVFVLFKLHHLLRTISCEGVYSLHAKNELSDFEKMLKMIKYTKYTKRLKNLYDKYVMEKKPLFNNQELFPFIGNGMDYWYMPLPDIYDMTTQQALQPPENRGKQMHFKRKVHTTPFCWRRPHSPPNPQYLAKGPYVVAEQNVLRKSDHLLDISDRRFQIYLKHYKNNVDSNLLKYIDFHINVLMSKKCSILNI